MIQEHSSVEPNAEVSDRRDNLKACDMKNDSRPPSNLPVRSTECSANVARENGIKEIRYLCDEALDHQMGWKSFCEMVKRRLEVESAFVEMASSPNSVLGDNSDDPKPRK